MRRASWPRLRPGPRAPARQEKRDRDEAPAHPGNIALPDPMAVAVGYSTANIVGGMGMGRIVTVTVGAATARAEGAGGGNGSADSTVLAGR